MDSLYLDTKSNLVTVFNSSNLIPNFSNIHIDFNNSIYKRESWEFFNNTWPKIKYGRIINLNTRCYNIRKYKKKIRISCNNIKRIRRYYVSCKS